MQPSNGLVTAMNAIRNLSVENGTIYHKYVPAIKATTAIGDFGTPILSNQEVENEFMHALIQRIGRTMIEAKQYTNPLKELEGDELPLGGNIQNIHVNPIAGRHFDVNDFAGLLQKYEADVKVEYLPINQDIQYPVTITRDKLRNAFTSWAELEKLVNYVVDTLYTSAYRDEYKFTKMLVSEAYRKNQAVIETCEEITDETTAKKFVKQLRKNYLKFKSFSSKYNAWHKMGGEGRPVETFTQPEDVVVLMNADVATDISVDVIAQAFNMSATDVMGRVIEVDDFNEYGDEGELIYDGSKIKAIICDRRWFKLNLQDQDLSDFYNANNRSWNYYLNVTRGYNHSLFANGVILATEQPTVKNDSIKFDQPAQTIKKGSMVTLTVTPNPINTTDPITYSATAGGEFVTLEPIAGTRMVRVIGKGAGAATIQASCNNKKATVQVTVTE